MHTPLEFFRRLIKFIFLSGLFYSATCLIFSRNPLEIFDSPAFNGNSSKIVDSLISTSILLPFFYLGGNVYPKNLLGMLIVGMLFHLPPCQRMLFVDSRISALLRKMAFIVILVRGGLSIDPVTLKKLKFTLPTLAVVPIVIEVMILSSLSVFILGFDWWSGLAVGFLIAAVSPAVVVPCMLEVEKKGYGQQKGITTLCIAGATLSDVLCITAFSIILGFIFGSERSTMSILLHVPVEIGFGVLIGLIGGFLIKFCSNAKTYAIHDSKKIDLVPTCLILLASLAILLGSSQLGSEVIGPISILSLGFFTAIFIKEELNTTYQSMKAQLDHLWKFIFMPLLFGLIGFRIDFVELFFGESANLWHILLMVFIIILGIVFRLLASYLSILGQFDKKEKLFIAFAWLPKATIQAALATAYLDKATEKQRIDLSNIGNSVLLMAVLSIFLSAPMGQFLIRRFSTKLLEKDIQPIDSREKVGLVEIAPAK